MADSEFLLPDVGEGLTEAEIVAWKVKAGDVVEINQVLVEIETAKSLVELPSPFAGTVSAILVAEGETVDVGTPIITVGTGAVAATAPAKPKVASDASAAVEDTAASITVEEKAPATLVGYGTRGHVASRRRRADAGSIDAVPAAPTALADARNLRANRR